MSGLKFCLPIDIPALKGCWGDRSSLLMLPHMDDEAVDRLQQQGVHTVAQLATMPEKHAAALLACVLGAGKAVSDVQQVGEPSFVSPSQDLASAGHCLRGQLLRPMCAVPGRRPVTWAAQAELWL